MFPAHRCSANLIKSLFSACQAEPEKERVYVCTREKVFFEKVLVYLLGNNFGQHIQERL